MELRASSVKGRDKVGSSTRLPRGSDTLASGLAVASLALLVGFVSLPLLSLVVWTVDKGTWRAMASPVAVDALLLSLRTTAITMAILLLIGTPAAWARALGEFGATIIFAGSFRGVTQTIPLAIIAEFQRDLDAAVALSVLVLGFAFAVILAVRYLTARSTKDRA